MSLSPATHTAYALEVVTSAARAQLEGAPTDAHGHYTDPRHIMLAEAVDALLDLADGELRDLRDKLETGELAA